MDAATALLIIPPVAAPPSAEEAAEADALIALPPADADAFGQFGERVRALIEVGRPLYVAIPPVDTGLARELLLAALAPGVYGVVARPPSSIEQLRYVEGILEEAEERAEIRPGLTALAIGFGTPKALAIMPEALDAMRRSAGRVTWIAWNAEMLARELGAEPASPTIALAASQVVLAAAADGVGAVRWINGRPKRDEIVEARALGFCGLATTDAHSLRRIRGVFPGQSGGEGEAT